MSTPPVRGRTRAWDLAVRVAALVVIWVALWGQPSVGNFIGGTLAVGAILWLFPGGPGRLPPEHEGTLHPIAATRFALYFLSALFVATWDVAVTVLMPGSKVSEAIVAVPLRSRSPVIATIVANAITLTPGTMTVEVDDPSERGEDSHIVLYVHVLGLGDAQSIRDDGLGFERLAVRAFGSRADRERWARAEAASSASSDPSTPADQEEPG